MDSHLQRLELVDSHLAEWWNSLDTYQAEMADTGSEQAEMADNGSEQAEMEDIGSLEAEEKSRVVPGKHWVVLQDLDTGTAVADMVLVLTAALTGMLADQSEDSHLLALAGKRLGHRMVGSSLYQDRWMHINPQLTKSVPEFCKQNKNR